MDQTFRSCALRKMLVKIEPAWVPLSSKSSADGIDANPLDEVAERDKEDINE